MNEESISESIRKRKIIVLLISVGILGSLSGIFVPMYVISDRNYNSLSNDHSQLLSNYQILTGDYDTLFDSNEDLELQHNSTCSIIKQQILPVQYCFFGEAVRRYYMPKYLEGKITKEYWKSFSEFCRD